MNQETNPLSRCASGLEIGVMVNNLERDRLKAFRLAAELGFQHVHTSGLPEKWLCGPEREAYIASARASGVIIDTMFVAFDGQSYANIQKIANTVGLANPATREHRCQIALRYIDLAVELGAPSLAAHLGLIPENPDQPSYAGLIQSLRTILDRCEQHGLSFHLETGQESAATLVQFVHDVDRPYLGVNFDPANFILYGADEPVSALDALAPWVRGVHCKDGVWPDQRGELGREMPIGQGAVNFPALVRKLLACGYHGTLIIEREHGPSVIQDVEAGRSYLDGLLRQAEISGRKG
jgi:sugar phosphate isomerase/epimerase